MCVFFVDGKYSSSLFIEFYAWFSLFVGVVVSTDKYHGDCNVSWSTFFGDIRRKLSIKIGAYDIGRAGKIFENLWYFFSVHFVLIIVWHHEESWKRARSNYDYEFLIKMTFIWEFDGDKVKILGVPFIFTHWEFGWVAYVKWVIGAACRSSKMTTHFIRCLSI